MAEWTVAFALEQAIAELELLLNRPDTGPFEIAAKVGEIKGLKIELFADEHPPPHFRVTCSGETGNYTIRDCTQINGGLLRQYKQIRKWHTANKQLLIQEWDARRPTDCPIGKYRDDNAP